MRLSINLGDIKFPERIWECRVSNPGAKRKLCYATLYRLSSKAATGWLRKTFKPDFRLSRFQRFRFSVRKSGQRKVHTLFRSRVSGEAPKFRSDLIKLRLLRKYCLPTLTNGFEASSLVFRKSQSLTTRLLRLAKLRLFIF